MIPPRYASAYKIDGGDELMINGFRKFKLVYNACTAKRHGD